MYELLLSSGYESLGRILRQLSEAHEIQAAPELAERMRQALFFHERIAADWQELLTEHQELREQVSALTRVPGERVCNGSSQDQFSKYEDMRKAGARPQDVYWAAKDDKLDEVGVIAVLRKVFQLSLPEAQAVLAEAEQELQQPALA